MRLQERGPIVLMGVLALSAGLAAYDPEPVMAEAVFQVNTTEDSPVLAAVDKNDSGDFVVVWQGKAAIVRGQRFDMAGTMVGSEFPVSKYGGSARGSVGLDNEGNMVAVWQDSGSEVYGQRYNTSGVQIGPHFQCNTYAQDKQIRPDIAMSTTGGSVVVWQSFQQQGPLYGYGVYGQRYSECGCLVGLEFDINTTLTDTGDDLLPVAAISDDGSFVVVWQAPNGDGNGFGILGQRYDASGNRAGSEFQINEYTLSNQKEPDVAMSPSGGLVVVWQSEGQDAGGWGVYARVFDNFGNPVGTEFQVNTSATTHEAFPTVDTDASGNFAVAYLVLGQNARDVAAQKFFADGTKLGNELSVTGGFGSGEGPALAMDDVGNFVVAFQGDPRNIFARLFPSGPVAVLFSTVSATVANHAVELVWNILPDQRIQGFKIYRRQGIGDEASISSRILPREARRYVDDQVQPGGSYHYAVGAVLQNGEEIRSTSVDVQTEIWEKALSQNYPNPFNPSTTIAYVLDRATYVNLSVYDVSGSFVITLVDGTRSAGTHKVVWDGRDQGGNPVGSGSYFYRLQTGTDVASRNLVLIR